MASPPIAAHDLKVRSVAFIIVLWIGLFCIAEINARGSGGEVLGKTQREFDYFKLALQWPGTFCRRTRHCCSTNGCCRGSNAPQGFTIHGLWPDYNDGTWPSCCSGKKFDVKEVSTLLGDMNKYWPTLSCGSTSNCHGGKGLFWEHEWEKHGTCSSSVTGAEYNYFVTGLNLYFKYNVTKDIIWSEDEERLLIEAGLETNGLRELNVFQEDLRILSKIIEMQQKESKLLKEKSKDRIGKNSYQEVLREAGYVASNSEKYPLGGIISAIQNAFHLTPELECSGGAVQELRLCFYKDFKPRDCAADAKAMVNSKKSCPKYVSLPEYASLKLGDDETEASEPTLQSAI